MHALKIAGLVAVNAAVLPFTVWLAEDPGSWAPPVNLLPSVLFHVGLTLVTVSVFRHFKARKAARRS